MRESDRLNDTIRSFLSYARPQPPRRRARRRRPPAARYGHPASPTVPRSSPRIASISTRPMPVRSSMATMGQIRAGGVEPWPPTACGPMPEADGSCCARAGARATETGETRVAIEVADEGVGIAPISSTRCSAVPRLPSLVPASASPSSHRIVSATIAGEVRWRSVRKGMERAYWLVMSLRLAQRCRVRKCAKCARCPRCCARGRCCGGVIR